MKIITVYILIFLVLAPAFTQNGDKNLPIMDKNEIIGRWESRAYTLDEIAADTIKPEYVYYFKDMKTFHRGNIIEGAIIFNITGRYSVSGDTIKMYYQDYLNQTQTTRKLQTTLFKVFYHNENRMDVDVIEPKGQTTPMTLKRQGVLQ